jgi:hypothetical protein
VPHLPPDRMTRNRCNTRSTRVENIIARIAKGGTIASLFTSKGALTELHKPLGEDPFVTALLFRGHASPRTSVSCCSDTRMQ